jgi:autophagy-related protein 13
MGKHLLLLHSSYSSSLLTGLQFNVLIGDADVLARDMNEWRLADVVTYKPPTLIVEIYIDLADLTKNQTLVILDDDGKRWDVDEMLNSPSQLASRPGGKKVSRVVLERWTVEVGPRPANLEDEESLSHVYKKAVVLIRSLFTYARLLPAQKYWRRIQKQPPDRPSLKPKYRIINGTTETRDLDTLSCPLHPDDQSVVEKYRFHPSPSPVGPLCIAVEYRTNCEFRVDNAESLLSSRFMGLEEDLDFKPSLPSATRRPPVVPGSMPTNRNYQREKPDLGEAYGSMSTFHQVGNQAGTSPISALRAARDMPSSPVDSPPTRMPPNHRIATGSKSSLRSDDAPHRRRPSVSFQPFKAGSLSSSPAPGQIPPSPTTSSIGSRPTMPTHTRNRSSQYALPQQALRAPSIANETAIASSTSSSPKPAPISRYQSSFSNRKSRFSLSSRAEDDAATSDKGSITSARPGSATNENEGGSSGSFPTDEDEISDLLKLIESKRELKSLNQSDTTKTSAMLSKYRTMKDTNAATAAMADSFSSSLMLHRSSSSSSRQLSSVPPMVAGTSVSTSSSPGKPISPHTPHTPAIPSRLSANSTASYEPRRSRAGDRTRRTVTSSPGDDSSEAPSTAHGDTASNTARTTIAIDIPTSPRAWPYVRRSSSVSQQSRAPATGTGAEDEDIYSVRSTSLPNEDRPDLSLSELLLAHTRTDAGSRRSYPDALDPGELETSEQPSEAEGDGDESARQSTTSSRPVSRAEPQQQSMEGSSSIRSPSSLTSPMGPPTISNRGASAPARPRAPRGRFGSGSSGRVNYRPPQMSHDDDEPLLFAMSDFGVGRRSLEEGRGGGAAGERGSGSGRRGPAPWRGS